MGNPSPFMDGDDEKLKEIFEQTYDLTEFATCKSFDELAERFEKVTGEPYDKLKKSESERSQSAATEAENDYREEAEGDAHNSKVDDDDDQQESKIDTSDAGSTDDDDDLLSEFQNLLDDQ
jgi:DNA-binding ferritin-like protein